MASREFGPLLGQGRSMDDRVHIGGASLIGKMCVFFLAGKKGDEVGMAMMDGL